MTAWFLTYSYPLPPPGLLSAWVLEDGQAELDASGEPASFVEGHHGEIGTYRHDLGKGAGARLRTAIEGAVSEAPAKNDPVRPGTPILAFGTGQNRKVGRIVSFPLNKPLPPAAARFQQEMVTAVRELLHHPVRTIRGTAQWKPSAEQPGGTIALAIRVVASGQEPVQIRNPAATKTGEPSGIRIDLVADKPWDQLGPNDSATIEIVGGEVREAGVPSPKALALLDPGKALELEATIQRQAFITPGRYRAVIWLESGSKKASRDRAVDGVLQVVPPPLVVQPPTR